MSHNHISIIGTLGKDVEVRNINGTSFGSFSIAFNEKYKKQSGEEVQKTHWFSVKVVGKLTETIEKFFKKGDSILVEGVLSTDTYEKDGKNITSTYIKMTGFSFIGKKNSTPNDDYSNVNNHSSVPTENVPPPGYSDLPF